MNPGKHNLICPQRATFTKSFRLYDSSDVAMSLSGYTAAMEARETYASESALFTLTSPSSGITISANEITVTIPWTDTQDFPAGKYVWDLVITSSGGVKSRIVEGSFTVTPGVTQ